MSETRFTMIGTLILIAILLGLGWLVGSYICYAKWSNSHMPVSWGPVQGCLIQHDGKWIPTEAYREIP